MLARSDFVPPLVGRWDTSQLPTRHGLQKLHPVLDESLGHRRVCDTPKSATRLFENVGTELNIVH
jgi:hypothetical protein